MIVRKVASLTHALRVEQSVGVGTVVSILVPAELPVARATHVLGVVLAVHVRTLCDQHDVGLLGFLS